MTGTVYVLHIEPAYRHAGHYVGFCDSASADARVSEHLAGTGSPLIRAAIAAGHAVELVASWAGTRNDERRVKRMGGHGNRVCPRCRGRHLAARKRRRHDGRPDRPEPDNQTGGRDVFEQECGGDTHRPIADGVRCECDHGREQHPDAASGDTRCLVVAERERLTDVFDDGREGQLGYRACLWFREERQLSLDVEATALERLGTTDAGFEERILDDAAGGSGAVG